MESYGLDMEDIFDTQADLDDDLAVPPPMPDFEDNLEPLHEIGEQEEGEDGTDADVLSKLKDLSKGAAKKKVMRPQPKLDLERLKSERGLRALPKIFEAVKFKGKGHEAEDLGLLMGKLEHWAHRLYPKHPFDDFLERLEKLGTKKPVQTCIKRIRLDMDEFGDDTVRSADEQEEDTTERGMADGDAGAAAKETSHLDAEEAYEEMMREEREMAERRKQSNPAAGLSPKPGTSQGGGDGGRVRDKSPSPTPTRGDGDGGSLSQGTTSNTPSDSQSGTSLTDEQIARMERNRHLALERRLAKLGKSPASKAQAASSSQTDGSSHTPKPCPKPSTTGDELEDNQVDSEELGLHLTETAQMTSSIETDRPDAQDTQTRRESGKLGVSVTKESEGTEKAAGEHSVGLRLRMSSSETEESDEKENTLCGALELRMTGPEGDTSRDSFVDVRHRTAKMELGLSESEVALNKQSELLRLQLSESEALELCMTGPEGDTSRDSFVDVRHRTAKMELGLSESEVALNKQSERLRLQLSESEAASDHPSERLRLQLSESEAASDHPSEHLRLQLSESEATSDHPSERLRLQLSESEDVDSGASVRAPQRKESELENILQMSLSEEESGGEA